MKVLGLSVLSCQIRCEFADDWQKPLKVNKYIRIILRSLAVPQSHKKLTQDSGHAGFVRWRTSLAIAGAKGIPNEQVTRGPAF